MDPWDLPVQLLKLLCQFEQVHDLIVFAANAGYIGREKYKVKSITYYYHCHVWMGN